MRIAPFVNDIQCFRDSLVPLQILRIVYLILIISLCDKLSNLIQSFKFQFDILMKLLPFLIRSSLPSYHNLPLFIDVANLILNRLKSLYGWHPDSFFLWYCKVI